jgi:RecA-family ATPase
MSLVHNTLNSPRVDFAAVKAASIGSIDLLLDRWLPGGKRQGNEYVVRNPTRADANPGSFSVNRRTGVFADFATGDRGGDMVDLYRFLHGGDLLEAARAVGNLLGVAEIQATAQIHSFPVGQRVSEVLPPQDTQRDPATFPPRTPADSEGRPRFIVADSDGPPIRSDESRRHFYLTGTTPMRVKIMRKGEVRATNLYRVVDVDGVTGWQSRKPVGFAEMPFIGIIDPFHPNKIEETLYWPEGERDTETLADNGFAAFTFGGTGDGLPEGCEEYVRGRSVVILADNDPGGVEHAEKKAAKAASVASSVRIIHFTDLPPKGDVTDFFAKGGTPERLRERVMGAPLVTPPTNQQQPAPRPKSFKIVSAAELFGQPIPPRMWHVPDVIPGRNVTLLQGDGATGKSLLALMLAASTVLGNPWIGLDDIERGPAIYLSAEDELPELHRRLDSIAEDAGVTLRELSDLHLIPLAGEDAILAAPMNRSNIIEATVLWGTIERVVAEIRPRLVVLDTLADLFAGEENQRTQARQFISLLRGLALKHNTCVMLLGHPSLEGLKSGSGTSGSTGWNNSVRSRLYFQRVFSTEGSKTIEADEDVRDLTVMKANYGPKGAPIRLKWVSGVFRRQSGGSFGLNTAQRDAVADDAFLTLLRLHERLGIPVSPSASSLYAPTVFASHSQAGGVTKRAFKGAMERLLERGNIRVVQEGPPSKRRARLTVFGEEEA